jgi:TP901 family phage tail tape measure protein
MMPDQINQTLSLDATQAIKTLHDLDAALVAYTNNLGAAVRAMNGFNKNGGKTVGALKRMKTAAGEAKDGLGQIQKATSDAGNAAKQSGEEATKAASKWTVSWQTMGRVVATQAIVRGLNIIRQSLKAAIGDAVDFQRAVAEIQTIGRDMGGFENIAGVVRRISDEFNVELGDTAEAVYQVISNQIAQSADAVEQFTGSAAKFSKVTKTDLATSVNLLSGTLNAFGKTVADTDDVAAKFFKTIELGRTRAEELAQGYGTVAPTAEKLGIAFEDINAAMATLTIQGIQTDKAFTQVRGLMQSFLKPTTDMTRAMRELGFATGEQLLEAYNLQEALRAVVGTTDGTAAAVAKLIPRIRGLTGGLGLVNDEAEHFTKTVKEQETALEDAYDKAYDIVITTDAERITKELNKVKNFFTTEFGEAVLKSAIDMSELLGGAENLLLVFESMAAAIPAVAGALLAYGTVTAAVAVKTWLFTAAADAATLASIRLHAALGLIAIAGVAIAGVAFAFKKIQQVREQELADALAVNDEKLSSTEKRIAKELSAEKKKFDELKKFHAQELAEFRKVYLEEVEIVKEDNDSMVASTKWALDQILGARKAAVEAIGKASSGLTKRIEDSRKAVKGLQTDLDNLLFERKVKGTSSQEEKLRLLKTEAAKASQKAVALQEVGDEKAAIASHKRAISLNEEAYSLDIVSKSRSRQNSLDSQARVFTNNLTKASENYQARLGEEKVLLAENAREASSMLAVWDAQKKKILELHSVYDEKGQPLDAATVAANRVQIEKEIATLLESVAKDSEKLGLDGSELTKKYFKNLALDMDSVEVQTLLAAPDNMEAVYAKVDAALQKLADANPIRLEIELFATLEDLPLGSAAEWDAASSQLNEAKAQVDAFNASLKQTSARAQAAQEDAQAALAKMKLAEPGTISTPEGPVDLSLSETQKAYNSIVREMRAMAASGNVNIDLLNGLITRAQALRDSLSWYEADPFSAGALSFQAAADALGLIANLQNIEQRDNLLVADTDAGAKFREIAGVVGQMETKLKTSAQASSAVTTEQEAQTTAVLSTNSALSAQVDKYNQITTAIRSASVAQKALATSTKPAGQGVITNPYFAAGGTARGTDTIPAMLSPGERVTDAKNSRRFFSQLQAIGAGQKPVYRNAGGDTYNTNVGDINVQDTSGRPYQTAREVMRQIKREQRRGSGSI